ncbi:M23 family metallopeptidase [Allobranchiibius sp. CTAmp26]|uniref:M23 family metallopeptidase n=1 Tax=Allobranchiibius sp. CTAmp26 TaxID=2815214 RepID=UPI001AA11D7D|nr:M23 family metallopeptidase [Allobranchiibius sp. CTAmp26]MBO1756477.1 peptidoglycan DD-metalloendopeptidase family protein [Allobranchiibius sp. CTAmp26]
MKKFLLGLAVAVTLTTAVPLFAVILVVVVASPAAGEVIATQQCQGDPTTATGSWRVPTAQHYVITSGFGPRPSPGGIGSTYHEGVDIAMLPAPGSVLAAASGRVSVAGPYGGLGNAVVVDDGDGISTTYGHLARLDPTVRAGATVTMGQRLGAEGSTGNSTGDHLHFGVAQDGKYIDPVPFMRQHGAPLDGRAVPASAPSTATPPANHAPADPAGEGGIGFPLPLPGQPRRDSVHAPPLPIPPAVQADFERAATRYKIPWTLLAGIGMEETGQGRNEATSSAGAEGLMQFEPSTWARYGVDGDGDGRAVITDDADSAMSAANYLTAVGVTHGTDGVRRAIFAYNHATWYVNDVLFYAAAYGGGEVLGDPIDCGTGRGSGNPGLPPIATSRVGMVLTWAERHRGDGYVLGADGPHVWDCSSFSAAAYRRIGITMPRTAQGQQEWLAAGNGFRVAPRAAKPGDLVFFDSYLGPNVIRHVEIVLNPATHAAIGAQNPQVGVAMSDYAEDLRTRHIFQVWRVGNISG